MSERLRFIALSILCGSLLLVVAGFLIGVVGHDKSLASKVFGAGFYMGATVIVVALLSGAGSSQMRLPFRLQGVGFAILLIGTLPEHPAGWLAKVSTLSWPIGGSLAVAGIVIGVVKAAGRR